MQLEVGRIVGGYEILGILGAGSMGQVFRVRNTLTERIEAMKVLKPHLLAQSESADRFIAEIRILASITHPNIAQLYTALHIDNQLVMLMELVKGQPLQHHVKNGMIPVDEALRYILQLLSALSYAHDRGVIHRDIKPSNIMIAERGSVKLMDFGVARSNACASLTRPGVAVGSILYMSPEQMSGAAVDRRSDLYAVGVLLYELLTGRRPFDASGMGGLLRQKLSADPAPPIELNPRIARPLNDLILSSLAKEPARRFQSADAMARALRRLQAQQPHPMSAPPGSAAHGRPPVKTLPDASRRADPRPQSAAGEIPLPFRISQPAPVPGGFSRLTHSRITWVAAGAGAALLICAIALQVPGLLPGASASSDREIPPVQRSAADVLAANDLVSERQQIIQLRSRADSDYARLVGHPLAGENGDRAQINRQFDRIRAHLRSAQDNLNRRDSAGASRELATAQKEIASLESNFSH